MSNNKKAMRIYFLLRTILSSLFIITGYLAYAQEIEWQKTIGGDSADYLYSISLSNDGGYFCGGNSSSSISGNKSENSLGGDDFWVVKLDSIGNIQWQNTFGGNGTDWMNAISATPDGGCICTGGSYSNISGDKTEDCLGIFDCWIVKLNSGGTIEWQNTIGGNYTEEFKAISPTSDGGYICGGNSNSDISGDKTEINWGFNDYWVVKLDSIGNIQWQNTIGGYNNDELTSISQTLDGGFICGGYSSSGISGKKTENCKGSDDFWIVKLDSSGIIEWQNTIGGNNYDRLYSISQTSNSGYICGGSSASGISGDKTENYVLFLDFWILKLSPTGNILWQNTIGGEDYDWLASISQTADGGYICGGTSRSNFSGDKSENSLIGSYWIICLDSVGTINWQNTIDGDSNDVFSTIIPTLDGNYICGGYSNSDNSGDKNNTCLGLNDYWVVKITTKYNSIKGKLFIDSNSNNLQDAGEPFLSNKKTTEINTGRFSFADQNGNYSIYVLDPGNYTVNPDTISFYNEVPVSHSASFSGINLIDSLNDFAFQPSGIFNDLCVTMKPLGGFRSNSSGFYTITYCNYGTTSLNGNIIFIPDSNITFLSSSNIPFSISSDSIVWNIGLLTPFQIGSMTVIVLIDSGLPLSTLINPVVHIEPLAGDVNPASNNANWACFTTNSFDPNNILVSDDVLTTSQLTSPHYIDYIINFQNTGNDTAFTVKILDPIDTNKLDLSTIEFISSSHPVNMNYIYWEKNMELKFNNILLPDSNVNEVLSHGFVRYRIKPKTTLLAGDSILNFAAIYFDYNLPVFTNIALTTIVLPTGTSNGPENFVSEIQAYPNPAHETITIKFNQMITHNPQLSIIDMFGRKIYNSIGMIQNFKEGTFSINLKNFANGVYFIQLNSETNLLRGKFIKQ